MALRLNIIVLAAGKGTRMCSTLPKVMHPALGKPLIHHVLDQACTLNPEKISIVISPELKDLTFSDPRIHTVIQDPPLGTGHAVQHALNADIDPSDLICVLPGDVPALQVSSLQKACDYFHIHPQTQALVLAMEEHKPNSYGRLVVHEGHLDRIIEVKDASEDEKKITLCNSGILFFRSLALEKACAALEPSPVTGEYYLTDTLQWIGNHAGSVGYILIDALECQGVNTQEDLANVEKNLQNRKRLQFLQSGVRMMAPETVHFSHDTVIASDVVIEPYVVFGPKVCIQSGSVIHSFCYLEGCDIHKNARVGPFARLRPGTCLAESAKVGNFVEIKNSTLGMHTKVNHLSYIGDAQIGNSSNIGAGTITCNYDGFTKSITRIGQKVFVGSNSALIAPLTIGDGAMIAAGSTVTKDVPEHALTIARSRQTDLTDGALKIQKQKQKKSSS